LADKVPHEPKLNNLDLAVTAPIQLDESGWYAADVKHMDFVQWVLNDGLKVGIAQSPAAVPVVISPNLVVQEAIIRHGRPLGVQNEQTVTRLKDGLPRGSLHLQVEHRHWYNRHDQLQKASKSTFTQPA
jgi:hypothetical protein